MSRAPVSLVIITLNAVKHLEKCIRSVPDADEIIVVDSGSTDGTQVLAKELGARVIVQEWLGFGPQKQFAIDQAQHDWVLCLDADESLSPELRDNINEWLSKTNQFCFRMARCNQFLGRELRHGEGYPDWNVRLFHRQHAGWSSDMVHEHVICRSDVGTLKGDLYHDSAPEIADYLRRQNSYTTIQAEALFKRGKRVSFAKLVLSPFVRFIRFYFFRLGCLDGVPGLIHISIGCFNSFIKYAKLMELHKLEEAKSND